MLEEKNDIFDSKISLHDRHRFEIKLDMELPPAAKTVYEVESYFFVPRALNIGPHTYTKEDFYNNNQRYIRFKTPKIGLSKICDPKLATSPLNRVKDSIAKILSGSKDPELVKRAYDEFKLLGCVIRGEMRDHVKMFIAGIETYEQPGAGRGKKMFLGEEMSNFINDLKYLMAQLNGVKTEVTDPAMPVKLRDTFNFFDEYCSLIIEEYLTTLLEALRKSPAASAAFKEVEGALSALVVEQGRYRAAMNYPSLLKGENEVFIYRRSVLKKFISSALYLKTELHEWETLTQVLLGAAAGLAMLFAAMAAIYAQNRYTMNSVPFVLIIVISYIFKDRIKDWLKLLFSKSLTRWISDRKIKILDPANGRDIGVLKEGFTFIADHDVPPDISRIRNIDNITSIDEDGKPERVFKYKKVMVLYPERIQAMHDRRRDLNDILRFNIRSFVVNADDPRVIYPFVMTDGQVKMALCSRVYHMNMIIKYSYMDAHGQKKIHFDRMRIVLNKEGLVRLEEVKIN